MEPADNENGFRNTFTCVEVKEDPVVYVTEGGVSFVDMFLFMLASVSVAVLVFSTRRLFYVFMPMQNMLSEKKLTL